METEMAMYMFLLLGATTYVYLKQKKRVRRWGVRPINRLRNEKGIFGALLTDMLLKDDHESFFKYTRMSPKMFFYLLDLVKDELQKNKSKNPIPPAHRLILTIHYLASGCSMQEIAFGHYLGLTTVSKIIRETTKVLWDVLQPLFLNPPNNEEWKNIENAFYRRWNLPNCIGAIDGKHVHIQAPYNCTSEFFNYKKSHSLVLMASCDAFYRFTLVDIGAAGGNHDSTVFSESGFGRQILNGELLGLPVEKELPNSRIVLPHYFAADAAFPLHRHIMRPYPGQHLRLEQNIFNYRLSRARRLIENTFGILAQRWRILRGNILADYDTCLSITMACVVLHNFIQRNELDIPEAERRYCPTGFADVELPGGNIRPGQWRQTPMLKSVNRVGTNNATRIAMENRDLLRQYVMSPEGSVPWQVDYVLRGSVPQNFSYNV